MIFGVDAPKFVIDKGLVTEKIILLDHCIISDLGTETKFIEHESEIDLRRYRYKLGTHLDIGLTINLFKYDNPASKFDEIYQYLGSEVVFYLHRDKAPYQKYGGGDALFMLKEVKNFYLDSVDTRGGKKDGLILAFQSLTPVNLLLGVPIVIQIEDIVMSNNI